MDDINELEQKEDYKKPFVHKFFWFRMGSKHDYPDLLEYSALKLCNQAKCNLIKIEDAVDAEKNIEYYIVADGRKQKLMLLMELCKAWMSGIKYVYEKQKRDKEEINNKFNK